MCFSLSTVMLRSAFSALQRRVGPISRRYHPLAGQWSSPAGSGLVPIVIEQTVSGSSSLSFTGPYVFSRAEENVLMIYFRVYYVKGL